MVRKRNLYTLLLLRKFDPHFFLQLIFGRARWLHIVLGVLVTRVSFIVLKSTLVLPVMSA